MDRGVGRGRPRRDLFGSVGGSIEKIWPIAIGCNRTALVWQIWFEMHSMPPVALEIE